MRDLRKNIAKLFVFSVVDLAITRLAKYVGILILINVASRESIGILGIATGYVAILGYLSFTPEGILLRDFPSTKGRTKYFNKRVSAYINFWVLRSLVILFLSAIFAWYLKEQSVVLALVFFGILLQRALDGISNIAQLVFYVDFKQAFVARINTYYNFVLLIFFFIIAILPTIYTYVLILLVGQIILSLLWLYFLIHSFKFFYQYEHSWFVLIKRELLKFSLWYYLSLATFNFLQNVSPAILGLFASLASVGNYTISLKITGFFLTISQLMQKASFVHFANEISFENQSELPLAERRETYKTLFAHLKLYSTLSLICLIVFFFAGKKLISLFLTQQDVETIYLLTLILLSGALMYNIARPIMAFINAKFSLKAAFFVVYLPVICISLLSYFLSAKFFGAIGLASASIVSYAILFFLLLYFVRSTKYK